MVGGHAADLLGRHVGDGAHDGAGLGSLTRSAAGSSLAARSSRPLRQPEVEDLDAAVGGDEMLSGLRSRCTMPLAWAAARPSAICSAMSTARAGSGRLELLAQGLALEQLDDDVGRRRRACRSRRTRGCWDG